MGGEDKSEQRQRKRLRSSFSPRPALKRMPPEADAAFLRSKCVFLCTEDLSESAQCLNSLFFTFFFHQHAKKVGSTTYFFFSDTE